MPEHVRYVLELSLFAQIELEALSFYAITQYLYAAEKAFTLIIEALADENLTPVKQHKFLALHQEFMICLTQIIERAGVALSDLLREASRRPFFGQSSLPTGTVNLLLNRR